MNKNIKRSALPYYAVIFASQKTENNDGYESMNQQMISLAKQSPGFLGMESYGNDDGSGITISYWKDEISIKQWKDHAGHQVAQRKGKETWYQSYNIKICKVEKAYSFPERK